MSPVSKAMPFGGTRVGGEDYRFLNPADADDRRLLIIGEHPPAHHVVWTDPCNEEDLDGTNPRLHITIDEVVINQRWGVIHAIADLFAHHTHPALTRHAPFDEAAYRADLDALR